MSGTGSLATGNYFTSRVPMQFLSRVNSGMSITGTNRLINNPKAFYIQPGAVGQIQMDINGTTDFVGDGEYAPFAIQFQWDEMAYSDYAKLALLRNQMIDVVTIRNIGYYGKLLLDGPRSVSKVSDIVSTTATLYVLLPSDAGGAASCERVGAPAAAPTLTQQDTTPGGYMGGYIMNAAANYYWLTFSTRWGESLPSAVANHTASQDNVNNLISWAWPTTTSYVTGASLYINQTNDPTTAMKLADVINGETPQWTDYVGYLGAVINQQPPTLDNSFRGDWMNGIWVNESQIAG